MSDLCNVQDCCEAESDISAQQSVSCSFPELESGQNHSGRIHEMLCRAAFKLGIARSAWVRERMYALLCRSYADELSPLTDASIRDNATMLLKELKTTDAGR